MGGFLCNQMLSFFVFICYGVKLCSRARALLSGVLFLFFVVVCLLCFSSLFFTFVTWSDSDLHHEMGTLVWVSCTSCESSWISSVFQNCHFTLSTAMCATWRDWHSSCVLQLPTQQQCKTHWVVLQASPSHLTGTFVMEFQSYVMPPPSFSLMAQRSGHCAQCSKEATEVKRGGGGGGRRKQREISVTVGI